MTKARIAGFFYLLVFITGLFGFFIGGKFVVLGDPVATATNLLAHETAFRLGWVMTLVATACYVVVTGLFYDLFRPVNRTLSITAAFFSLVGCALGAVNPIFQIGAMNMLTDQHYSSVFNPDQIRANALMLLRESAQLSNIGLVFFGFYCLLIGSLILKATFLPRALGIGMLLAGLGWLTFLWPPVTQFLFPYNVAPGMLGEASLTLWLLIVGVNDERWKQQLIAIPEQR